MADGCVSGTSDGEQYRVTLALAEEDAAHVVKYAKFLDRRSPLEIIHQEIPGINSQRRIGLTVSSKHLTAALKQYGVGPRKSLTAEVSGGLEGSIDFWRGMVDGDGCLTWAGPQLKYPVLSLCGSRRCCEQFREFVLLVAPQCRAHVHPVSSIYAFTTSGVFAVEV